LPIFLIFVSIVITCVLTLINLTVITYVITIDYGRVMA
jgi:hypothetical protein